MQVSGFGRSVAACVPAEGYRIPAPSRSARRRSLAKSASGRVRKPTGICAAEPEPIGELEELCQAQLAHVR